MSIAVRKQKILAAVIENYIATGEPIGSKSLQSTDGLDVSSATIRNELADLTAHGFLTQPHTSAGRIPTEYGYRYYVDNLMKAKPLNERMKHFIESRLYSAGDSPESVIKASGELISELTGTVALATTPPGDAARIHRVKFVRTGRYTSMVVLITSSGMVKNRLFRCDFLITPEMLNVFDRALNEKLAGRPLSFVNRPFAQSFAASFGELGLLMPDMLTALIDACAEALGMNVYASGVTKLLYQSDIQLSTARGILEFVNDSEAEEKLMREIPEGGGIYIGRENSPAPLRRSAVIAQRYTIDNQPAGVLAVIGSTRIDYAYASAVLEYVCDVAGAMINELISK